MQICLTVVSGPHKGREFTFAQHDTFLVGRSRSAHFQLLSKDKYFSRIHFMMEVNPPQCRLIDLGSHNGTFVNGNRVLVADLKDGDQIRAGHTTIRLAVLRPEPEAASEPFSSLDSQTPLPPAEGDELPDWLPTHFGDHEVVRELGRGNMGLTLLARRAADGRMFAIKILRPTSEGTLAHAHKFLRDAQVLGALHHPHIVRLHELGEQQGLLYFVNDYVPGTDAAHLARPLEVPQVLHLADQALSALEYAHARKRVHRDIKPANVLLDEKQNAHLADFGLAHLFQKSQLSGLTMIQPGNVAFFPPEYITRYNDANPAGDQYSLAATLYFLLTGHPPLQLPEEVHGQFSMLLEQKADPIHKHRPDLLEKVAQPIDRALSREPKKRFANVTALRQALAGAQD